MKLTTRMLSLLLAIALFVCLLPAAATAEENGDPVIASGTVYEGITWKVTEAGTLYFQGNGPILMLGARPWRDYQDLIVSAVFEEGITKIGPQCCDGLDKLKTVKLPETLTEIDGFRGCSSLTDIALPYGLTSIGDYAFTSCKNLKELTIPETVVYLGHNAFSGTGLESITIPNSVNGIRSQTFSHCAFLKTVKLPDNVTGADYPYIGSFCFVNCTSLENVVIPNGVKQVYNNAFQGCTALKSVAIPATVWKIGREAFEGCTALTDKYYSGSAAQWSTVKRASGNGLLIAAKLHSYFAYLPYCDCEKPKYATYRYTGEAVCPKIQVKTASGTTLKEGVNYVLTYENNVLGDATVTATGIGKYSGKVSFPFRVLPAKVTNVKAEIVTAHDALLTWQQNPEAEKYAVYVDDIKQGETADNGFTLRNLESRRTYKVFIRAIITGVNAENEPTEYESLADAYNIRTPDENDNYVLASGVLDYSQYGYMPWELTADGVLTIHGKGRMSFYFTPFLQYKDWISRVELDDEITFINHRLFEGLTELQSVKWPKKLAEIGEDAFKGCTNLKSIVIPASVTKLGSNCFRKTGLESVVMTNCLPSIGCFRDCVALTSVKLPDSVRGAKDTELGPHAFQNCTSLESIVLPAGLRKIGQSAFQRCTALKGIVIPDTVRTIGLEAFSDCTALTDKYYNGSAQQWSKVTHNGENEALKAAKLHSYYTWLPYSSYAPKYSVYRYTGEAVCPKIQVKTASGTTLKEGVNYTVAYENNVLGDAVVRVTGIGKYFGEAIYRYRVLPAKVTNVKVTEVTAHTAKLTWTKNPEAKKYAIYIGATKKGETTKTNFTLENLKSNSTRKVYVRAVIIGKDENGEPTDYESLANAYQLTTPKAG